MAAYEAHGWTAHEFRAMLSDARPKQVKVGCLTCSRKFMVDVPEHLKDSIAVSLYARRSFHCPRCHEHTVGR